MTPRQAFLIQKSFKKIAPNGKDAAKIFYDHLFQIAPETRELFPEDMTQQYHKFMSMVETLVNSINRFNELVPTVKELGRRHVGYEVREEHFGAVADALLLMLAQGFGSGFSRELKCAWTAGYWRLALIMLDELADAPRGEARNHAA